MALNAAQQYVALSRVRSLEGLAVLQVDACKLTTNVVDLRAIAELDRLRNEGYLATNGADT